MDTEKIINEMNRLERLIIIKECYMLGLIPEEEYENFLESMAKAMNEEYEDGRV